ncbi:coth protein-domain-containing protein [Parasitella parasitica]|nr:coth protein-domain-containing protein [Parasitella parasitica]
MTFKIISLAPENQTVAVIVDDKIYPLLSVDGASSLLHTGKAPISSNGYRYALTDMNNASNIIDKEKFLRKPITNSSETLNEYYGRSWNSKSLDPLPTIMDPLPIINRIKSDLHIDGQIPTIHITGNQTAIDFIHANAQSDIDIPDLKMAYISPNEVKSFTNITLAISGHSTRSSDKLSYKIKIPKGQDLYDYRRLKLRAMATDASYMREHIAYDIAKSVGLFTSEYSYVRLYINEQAIGLFGLAEVFKNPWIRNVFADGDKDYKQGALFAAEVGGSMLSGGIRTGSAVPGNDITNFPPDGMGGNMSSMGSTSDLSYLGDNITLYSGYSVKEDPSSGTANYSRIAELTKFISEQSNSTATNDSVALWEEHMDLTSFLRGLALEVVISNSDGYFTMGNNYLLYDDLESERLVFSGQDFDLTMGTSINNATLMNSGNYSEFPNIQTRPFTSRMLVVPELKEEFENLILNYTTGIVNPKVLYPRIEQLYDFLQEDVAWDKSLPRVAASNFSSSSEQGGRGKGGEIMDNTNTTFHEAVNGSNGTTNSRDSLSLKNWIQIRSANILSFFNGTNA